MGTLHTETSKFLSFVLRHDPKAIGLTLDPEGWASIEALITGAKGMGHDLDESLIRKVVESSDKRRFAISDDGLRIRAVQGHSTDAVSIAFAQVMPPAELYHGTAKRYLDSILRKGLTPGERQYVHLSEDVTTARTVGARYGEPVVLRVEALRMHTEGFAFYRAENGVWLTRHVPVIYLSAG